MSWAETKTINSNPQVPLNKLIATKVGQKASEDNSTLITDFNQITKYVDKETLYDDKVYISNKILYSNIERMPNDNTELAAYTIILSRPNGEKCLLLYSKQVEENEGSYNGFAYLFFPKTNTTFSLGAAFTPNWLVIPSQGVNTRSITCDVYPIFIKNKSRYIVKILTELYYTSSNSFYSPNSEMVILSLDIGNDTVTCKELYRQKAAVNADNSYESYINYAKFPDNFECRYVGNNYIKLYVGNNSNTTYLMADAANNVVKMEAGNSSVSTRSYRELIYDVSADEIIHISAFGKSTPTTTDDLYTACGSDKSNQCTEYAIGANTASRKFTIRDDALYSVSMNSSGSSCTINKVENTYDIDNNEFSQIISFCNNFTFDRVLYYSGSSSSYYRYASMYMALFGENLYVLPPTTSGSSTYHTYYKVEPYIIKNVYSDNPVKVYLHEDSCFLNDLLSTTYHNMIRAKLLIGMGGVYNDTDFVIRNYSDYLIFNMDSDIDSTSGCDGKYSISNEQVSGVSDIVCKYLPSHEDVIQYINDLCSISYYDVMATKDLCIVYDKELVHRIIGDVTDTDYGCVSNSNGLIRFMLNKYTDFVITISF